MRKLLLIALSLILIFYLIENKLPAIKDYFVKEVIPLFKGATTIDSSNLGLSSIYYSNNLLY